MTQLPTPDDYTVTQFELWRNHVYRKTRCPKDVKAFVWDISYRAVGALFDRTLKCMALGGKQLETRDQKLEAQIMFLEFILSRPDKTIGWCFKAFKMRFSGVVTILEAKRYGLGLKPSSGLQTAEVRKLTQVFKDIRQGALYDPLIKSLQNQAVEPLDLTYSEDEDDEERGDYSFSDVFKTGIRW